MQCKQFRGGLLLLVALSVAGCGSADSASVTEPTTKKSTTLNEPQMAVSQFLDAVRCGNDTSAAAMFTPMARQKVGEMGLQVTPQGSKTARFEVGECKKIDDRTVHVESSWTDQDEEGQLKTDTMVWVVQQGEEGWRIAGMSATVTVVVFLDFENPEEAQETIRKLSQINGEISMGSSNQVAQQPQNPDQPIRR